MACFVQRWAKFSLARCYDTSRPSKGELLCEAPCAGPGRPTQRNVVLVGGLWGSKAHQQLGTIYVQVTFRLEFTCVVGLKQGLRLDKEKAHMVISCNLGFERAMVRVRKEATFRTLAVYVLVQRRNSQLCFQTCRQGSGKVMRQWLWWRISCGKVSSFVSYDARFSSCFLCVSFWYLCSV